MNKDKKNTIGFSNNELLQIVDILQSYYDDAVFEHNLQALKNNNKMPVFDGDHMTIKERGFIAMTLIKKLRKEMYVRGMCDNRDEMKGIQFVLDTFFKKETETEDWWAKRVSSPFHQIQVTQIQTDSFSLRIRKDVPSREQKEDTQ